MENTELEILQNQLAENPKDDKVLTALAFYYLENPDGRKELEFFEKAYLANPSIENTHNYAFWLEHDYGDWKKSIPLQQSVLAIKPNSYYPYLAYAQSLITKNWHNPYSTETLTQLIELYQITIEKIQVMLANGAVEQRFNLLKTIHNLAKCYIFLENYEKAEAYLFQTLALFDLPLDLLKAVKEEEQYFLMLDFVKLYWLTHQADKALNWLQKAELSPQKDKLDIADLYSRLEEYQQAYEALQGDFDFHEDWDNIVFALYQVNPKQWRAYYEKRLANAQKILQEEQQDLLQAQQNQDENAIQEALEYIEDSVKQIAIFQNILTHNQPVIPSNVPLYKEFYFNHFGCLLFGCQTCGNLIAD